MVGSRRERYNKKCQQELPKDSSKKLNNIQNSLQNHTIHSYMKILELLREACYLRSIILFFFHLFLVRRIFVVHVFGHPLSAVLPSLIFQFRISFPYTCLMVHSLVQILQCSKFTHICASLHSCLHADMQFYPSFLKNAVTIDIETGNSYVLNSFSRL